MNCIGSVCGFVRQMRGIRKPNWGHHNIGFDRAKTLGVASSTSSHIGSSRIFFFNFESTGAVHPVPRGLRFGEWFFLSRGVWWQR